MNSFNILNKQEIIETIDKAGLNIAGVIKPTELQYCDRLSKKYRARIFLKREDTQSVRSYKIRGAYNFISSIDINRRKYGITTASAGNHAQGVALSARLLEIKATIYMPNSTPLQKINRVKVLGEGYVVIKLVGDDFDSCNKIAMEYSRKSHSIFVPPFDDYRIIAGQGTVGKEIFEELNGKIDYILCPIGGGGLISGLSLYFYAKGARTEIIGVEPEGAAAMYESAKVNKLITLRNIDTFVDGVAVKRVGEITFNITKKLVKKIIVSPIGKICSIMIELYQNEGIISEPAGALSIAALDSVSSIIKNKIVVCVISGGNNDISRYPEIMERSMIYEGLKHYFIIKFAQKPGQLRNFVDKALGPNDDIVRFEYLKKSSVDKGPALVGIEISNKNELTPLLDRMTKIGLEYQIIKKEDLIHDLLI
jgi:threonine dehydratase